MKLIEVRCYSDEGNNAVLQLPNRRSPGILIQEDSFKNLLEMARTVRNLSGVGSEALRDEAEGLVEYLEDIYAWFDLAISKSGGAADA